MKEDEDLIKSMAMLRAAHPATNGKNVDPTANVIALVELQVKRIDDLRLSETRRTDQVMDLRAHHAEELRDAEAKRIDAIRAVDVNAVAVASEKATQQANVLATQVTASAETLRTLVATSAAALATQLTQLINPITDRISLLEKAQYEGAGKTSATDPAFTALVAQVRTLSTAKDEGVGKGLGNRELLAYIVAFAGLIGTVLGILGKL